jgi:hypothetical protein
VAAPIRRLMRAPTKVQVEQALADRQPMALQGPLQQVAAQPPTALPGPAAGKAEVPKLADLLDKMQGEVLERTQADRQQPEALVR